MVSLSFLQPHVGLNHPTQRANDNTALASTRAPAAGVQGLKILMLVIIVVLIAEIIVTIVTIVKILIRMSTSSQGVAFKVIVVLLLYELLRGLLVFLCKLLDSKPWESEKSRHLI